MFDKLKKLGKIKKLQDEFQKKEFEFEKEGVKAIVDGKFEVRKIVMNKELEKGKQEKILKECLNKALQKARKEMSQSFSKIV